MGAEAVGAILKKCGPPPALTAMAARLRSIFDSQDIHAVDRPGRHLKGRRLKEISVSDSERASAVPSRRDYFRRQNSTGSFQSAARFIDSWNSPSATAPSPKKQAVTRSPALHLIRERKADGERQPAADDGVAAIEACRRVEKVHGAAAPAAAAFDFPVHLRHDTSAGPARQRMTVLPVGRDHGVLGLQRLHDADGDGLLADIEMQEAADLARASKARRISLRSGECAASP